ncbi:hypothetical protein ORV05_10485 [Amycolatopsis cynarae]|uniref:Uncharacterized protein n=2 Tax=Amycolatopsis TaxID=1813 RepID=A0A558D6H8_9PSEU|nr:MULTISPECIES: hypothetical protein [Amycolatopsis]TVT56614.1 hypothetical protein FNH05_08240 [Amycolatopsis rhizosphaerae]WAL68167.1 hypothetical protein ORV05_10485 [Amycolatopsis sp. HUAS 11-8]
MRLEQNPMPATAAPRWDYRGTFGWPVRWHNDGLTLVTGSGITAVAIPKAMAGPVLAALARQGCSGPALSLPTKQGMVAILLAEADMLASVGETLPPEVKILTAGTAIPLPNERRPDDLAHWLVAPDTHQRWLPSLAAVLASIRSVRHLLPTS